MNNGPDRSKIDQLPWGGVHPAADPAKAPATDALPATGLDAFAEASLEAELRATLGRPLPLPAGFKERVLARAAAEAAEPTPLAAGAMPPADSVNRPKAAARVIPFRHAVVWRLVVGGALAASVIAGTFGVELERRQHEAARQAAMAQQQAAANQQFEEATRITDAALEHTRMQLERAGVFEAQGR